MKILRTGLLEEDIKTLWGKPLGTIIKHWWNKGWNEFPEIMFFTPISVVSTSIIIYLRCTSEKYTLPPKYYNKITIFRPEDPRVPHIRKDDSLKIEALK